MVTLGHRPPKEPHYAGGPLIGILAEMVKSALEWEAASQPEAEADSYLHQEPPGIDYPPTGPVPVSLGGRDEDAAY